MYTSHQQESTFLSKVKKSYSDDKSDYYVFTKELCVSSILHYLNSSGSMLELGCGWGEITSRLAPYVAKFVSVDGSAEFIKHAQAKNQHANVTFLHSLFEDLQFKAEFNYVIAAYVLEHVQDPIKILLKAYEMLKPGGLIYSVVPNAKAFSRQMAVEMDLMDNIYELTENDIAHGHRRVFDMQSLLEVHQNAGFSILENSAHIFKPFADFQMREMTDTGLIGRAQMSGLHKMARHYPEISNGIYVIARK